MNDKKVNWTPNAGPQRLALESLADETGYGGQAGGGKTDLLVGAALTQHHRAVIFRREYAQLSNIIQRSREMVGVLGSFNANDNIWRFASGRMLQFGACQHEKDKEKWQGHDHDLKGFDELTHFTESMFLYLSGWNRSTRVGQRCRVITTFNPPTTPEGEWVVRRYAPWLDKKHPNPAKPGELRWFVRIDGKDTEVPGPDPIEHKGEILHPRSRTFIPAALTDNPYLAGTGYESVLDQLPEPLRSQLKKGDFGVGRQDDPWQVIPTAWVEAAFERWRNAPHAQRTLNAIGVDVARGGDDKTVLSRRYGVWFAPLIKRAGIETPHGEDVVALIVPEAQKHADINVDVIGVGSSVYDLLRLMEYPVTGVNVAMASHATDRSGLLKMRNKRAELYWKFREALDPQLGEGIMLPPDDELLADLTAARWKMTMSGVLVESKEEIKERIGRSPDCGDAVLLAAMVSEKLEWQIY